MPYLKIGIFGNIDLISHKHTEIGLVRAHVECVRIVERVSGASLYRLIRSVKPKSHCHQSKMLIVLPSE